MAADLLFDCQRLGSDAPRKRWFLTVPAGISAPAGIGHKSGDFRTPWFSDALRARKRLSACPAGSAIRSAFRRAQCGKPRQL